jgi:hypothetical protein
MLKRICLAALVAGCLSSFAARGEDVLSTLQYGHPRLMVKHSDLDR